MRCPPPTAFRVHENYAHIGVGPRMIVVDIADPTQPAMVGKTERDGLQVACATVFLSIRDETGGSRGTHVVDASPSESLRTIGTLPLVFIGAAPDRPFAFETDSAASLLVVDVSDRLHPMILGGVSVSTLTGGTSVALGGSTIYATDGDDIHALDVSDLANMRQIAEYRARRCHVRPRGATRTAEGN